MKTRPSVWPTTRRTACLRRCGPATTLGHSALRNAWTRVRSTSTTFSNLFRHHTAAQWMEGIGYRCAAQAVPTGCKQVLPGPGGDRAADSRPGTRTHVVPAHLPACGYHRRKSIARGSWPRPVATPRPEQGEQQVTTHIPHTAAKTVAITGGAPRHRLPDREGADPTRPPRRHRRRRRTRAKGPPSSSG